MQTESIPKWKKLSNLSDFLESNIDFWGLPEILEQLALICDEKANHLRSNWQDEQAAESWESKGKVLLRAERQISKLD